MSAKIIPPLNNSKTLAKFGEPGAPVVALLILGVGSSSPFHLRDMKNRSFVADWNSSLGGHVIRIPLSLWQQNKNALAHDIMKSNRNLYKIPLFEVPASVPAEGSPEAELEKLKAEIATLTEDNAKLRADNENLLQALAKGGESSDEGQGEKSDDPPEDTTSPDGADTQQEDTGDTGSGENTGGSGSDETTQEQDAPAIFSALAEAVKDGAKRIKEVAAALNTDEQVIKDAADDPASPVEVVSGGWVKKKSDFSATVAAAERLIGVLSGGKESPLSEVVTTQTTAEITTATE